MARQKSMTALVLSDDERAQSTWALGNAYMSAASRLLAEGTGETFTPSVYLLGHALELHLKAFLACRGVSEKSLSRKGSYGHDLVACLRESQKHGLGTHLKLSRQDLRSVCRINRYYERKELEYFVAKTKRFGSIDEFQELVRRVSEAVFNPITESCFGTMASHSDANRQMRN